MCGYGRPIRLPSGPPPGGSTGPWWRSRAAWLYEALTVGELPDFAEGGESRRLPVDVELLGRIPISDGRLVLGDPYLMESEPTPITADVPPGVHAVHIARATVGPDHRRNAAALLIVDGAQALQRWEMALWPGQDPARLGPEEFFGYGVDAGTGCMAGVAAARVAARVLSEDAGMLEDPVSASLFGGGHEPGASVVEAEPGGGELAVFTSGWGDGSYPTWLGITADGDGAVAVTDFLLTGDPFASADMAVDPLPSLPRGPWWRRWLRR